MDWWQDKDNFIKELSSTENSIDDVYGRQIEPGKWEYAIVRWCCKCAFLICILRDGDACNGGDRSCNLSPK